MVKAIFIIVIVAEITLAGLLLATLFITGFRAWPPLHRHSWQFWVMWSLTTVAMGGGVLLGIIDWNTFIISHWTRYLIGGLLMVVGGVILTWGILTLGIKSTSGQKGPLKTNGIYRYSRNPQYVGDILLYTGYSLVCNSTLCFIAVAMAIICFILTPFTEEPWLTEIYGAKYTEYSSKVSRFLNV